MSHFYKIILLCSLFFLNQTYLSSAQAAQKRYSASRTSVAKAKAAKISKQMAQKILYGERKSPKNQLIGAHSPRILTHPDFVTEVTKVNSDGTKDVRLTKQYSDGKIANLKNSTVFPEHWSDRKILSATRVVSRYPALGTDATTGKTLHRGTIDGVKMEVIRLDNKVYSSYPLGGKLSIPDNFK